MHEEDEKLTTGIYIRVSTEEQAKEGFSINAQKEKLKQFAFARGWDIFDFYVDDGISGKNLVDRPEAQRLIQDVKDKKIDNVLVYKIDRLTRSVKNLMELIELFAKEDCAFNSLMESIDTSSATGRMFIKIVGIFAEFERENLAERVSLGIEQKVREGNYTNANGVYGYDYDKNIGDIVLNEDEAQAVKKIFEMYLAGTSMKKIANYLQEARVPTKRGGRWADSSVASILSNPLYIGKIRYGTDKRKNAFTVENTRYAPIVNEDTFNRVQVILKNRIKKNTRTYPSDATYFLTFLECGDCGRKLSTSKHTDPTVSTGKVYVNYYCLSHRRSEGCSCQGFSTPKIEEAFQDYIGTLNDFSFQKNKLNGTAEKTSAEEERFNIEKKIAQNERRLNEIRNLFTQDKLSFEEYKEISGTLSIKAEHLKKERDNIQAQEPQEIDVEAVKDVIVNLNTNWVNLTDAEKKQFLIMFVESIRVYCQHRVVTVQDIRFNSSKLKEPGKAKAKQKRLVY